MTMISKSADLFCSSSSCLLSQQKGLVRLKINATRRYFHRDSNVFAAGRRTYYDILELPRNASKKEIRAAFVDLSKKHHPDKNLDNPRTHDRFVLINKAYSTLIRPESKRIYDTSLSYRLQQEHMARTMASTHAYGSSTRPENWTEESSERSEFHDEFIFHMRDKSKDAQYGRQPYYGFRGLNRLSNAVIVWGCIGVLMLGALTHFLVIGASSRHALNVRDENDKRLLASYLATKKRARIHGTDIQLSLLSDKAGKTARTESSEDIDSK